MAAKFGTSGLRGLVSELTDDVIYRHVAAFIIHICSESPDRLTTRACVGWDFRQSSPAIVDGVVAALKANGVEPVLAGLLPTQAIANWAMHHAMPSIMVTGSHIPEDRNGLKFYSPQGEISKRDEGVIAQLAASLEFSAVRPAHALSCPDVSGDVISHFKQRYIAGFGATALSGLRLGVFQHSSVARDVLCEILLGLGAEVLALGREAGFVAVDTEALSAATAERLKAWASDLRFDAIVSADGDGDRPLLADETGRCLRGDEMGLLASQFLNADVVVTPVTSNSGIEKLLAGKVMRTAVGSPHVIAAMEQARQSGAQGVVGFEANGGFLVGTDFSLPAGPLGRLPTRDSVFPVVAVLARCVREGWSLSALKARAKLPCAASGVIDSVDSHFSLPFIADLASSKSALAGFLAPYGEVMSVDHTDGLCVRLSADRMVHFRASGNAPGFRIYVEDETSAAADTLLAAVTHSVAALHAAFLKAQQPELTGHFQS